MEQEVEGREWPTVWRPGVSGIATGLAIALGWAFVIPAIGLLHKPAPHLAVAIPFIAICIVIGLTIAYATIRPMLTLTETRLLLRNWGSVKEIKLDEVVDVSTDRIGVSIKLRDGRVLSSMVAGQWSVRAVDIRLIVMKAVEVRKSLGERDALDDRDITCE